MNEYYGPRRRKWLTKQFHCRRQPPATGKTLTPISQDSEKSFSHPVSYACDSPDSVSRYLLPMCPSLSFPASPALYQSSFVFLVTFRLLPLAHPIHCLPRTIGLPISNVILHVPNFPDFRVYFP